LSQFFFSAIAEEMKTKPFLAQGHLFLGDLYAGSSQKEKAIELVTKAETMFFEMDMDYCWARRARSWQDFRILKCQVAEERRCSVSLANRYFLTMRSGL